MKLNELRRPHGRKPRKTKRLGRGEASGQGKTAGKGNKGQNARSGGGVRPGFEGGQMPTTRRLPKRGFTNIFRKEYAICNLDALSEWKAGEEVTLETLRTRGVIKKRYSGLKVLGRGDVTSALVLKVDAISAEARRKIEAAGGRVEVSGG